MDTDFESGLAAKKPLFRAVDALISKADTNLNEWLPICSSMAKGKLL